MGTYAVFARDIAGCSLCFPHEVVNHVTDDPYVALGTYSEALIRGTPELVEARSERAKNYGSASVTDEFGRADRVLAFQEAGYALGWYDRNVYPQFAESVPRIFLQPTLDRLLLLVQQMEEEARHRAAERHDSEQRRAATTGTVVIKRVAPELELEFGEPVCLLRTDRAWLALAACTALNAGFVAPSRRRFGCVSLARADSRSLARWIPQLADLEAGREPARWRSTVRAAEPAVQSRQRVAEFFSGLESISEEDLRQSLGMYDVLAAYLVGPLWLRSLLETLVDGFLAKTRESEPDSGSQLTSPAPGTADQWRSAGVPSGQVIRSLEALRSVVAQRLTKRQVARVIPVLEVAFQHSAETIPVGVVEEAGISRRSLRQGVERLPNARGKVPGRRPVHLWRDEVLQYLAFEWRPNH